MASLPPSTLSEFNVHPPSRTPMGTPPLSRRTRLARTPHDPPSGPWQQVPVSSQVPVLANSIRSIVDGVKVTNDPDKRFINLGLGDPSVWGNMPPPDEAIDAIQAALRSRKADGYPPSIGFPESCKAVADYFDQGEGGWRVEPKDVVLAHGASGALDMVFNVMADSSKNVLFPRPLFSAYEVQIWASGAEKRYYDLVPGTWEIDLEQLEGLIDDHTAFILINNPSNPCGGNWSIQHLRDIAAIARAHRIVVVSDEVYAGMAWASSDSRDPIAANGNAVVPAVQGKFHAGPHFTPFASIAGDLPCLVVSALSKRWLAPGWRLGWVITHDPLGVLGAVRDGFNRWANRIQGPSSTMQRALPAILANTPQSFFDQTLVTLQETGEKLFQRLQKIHGLVPVRPTGAMYLMCGILSLPGVKSDKEFIMGLMEHENILILPGSVFRLDGYLRFVLSTPFEVLDEACGRLERYIKKLAVESA